MASIRLENQKQDGYTLLPDEFTDKYMASANGEFVKVYISLLRISRGGSGTFDMAAMADLLCCNERDVVRALKYWAEQGLVDMQFSDNDEIESLTICPLPVSGSSGTALRESRKAVPAYEPVYDIEKESVQARPMITAGRVNELRQDQAIVELLFVAEQYIGKPLSSNEMRRILYFYDVISMTPDLIQYLIEYCVSHGHKSVRYMEKVALAWKEEGITTVKQAQDNAEKRSCYYQILKAMGITGRNPVDEEITYMNTWIHDYGFSLDIISEACGRTVMKTGQGSFQYTERILSGWKDQNVHTLSDIQKLDEEYRRKKESQPPRKSSSPRGNRFNNFPQRQYDFSEYEKKLVTG